MIIGLGRHAGPDSYRDKILCWLNSVRVQVPPRVQKLFFRWCHGQCLYPLFQQTGQILYRKL